MNDLDPDRFTLGQADAAREAYVQAMEELDLVKELLARIPTRRDQAFTASDNVRVGSPRHPLVRSVLAALPLRVWS
jgi:hypothetical protein